MAKTPVTIGESITVTLPYSEVCMHMKVAGKQMTVILQSPWQAQLFDQEGKPFSFPISPGEAGIMWDDKGFYIPS
jgi:hypothetical protein